MMILTRKNHKYMMDIHTHILPGVDDGVQTYEEALAVLKHQLQSGVNKVVITPHVHNSSQKVSSKEYVKLFYDLKKRVEVDLPEMTLYLGYEVKFNQEKSKEYHNFVFQGFKEKYLLIEFSVQNKERIHDIVYNLVAKGFTPIIAHIERYLYLDMFDVERIRSLGAIIQVNSGAILGLDGKQFKKQAKKYFKKGFVDIIASDCHNLECRKPNLMEALKKAPKDFKMKVLEV